MNSLEKRLDRLERIADAEAGERRTVCLWHNEGEPYPDTSAYDDRTEVIVVRWLWSSDKVEANGQPS